MLKRLKVSNHLRRENVQNLQRLRFMVSMLHDNALPKSKDSDVEDSLCAVDMLRKSATAGKFVNYVFKQFHLKDDEQAVHFLKRLQKKHPDHAMPLQDLINSVNGTQNVYEIRAYKTKSSSSMPVSIGINTNISKTKAQKMVQMFRKLFKEYIPKKYLKLQPYL